MIFKRYILLLLSFFLGGSYAFAQLPTVTADPANFTVLDNVVLTFDVTGTVVEGEPEIFIWAWTNVADYKTNTFDGAGFGNSSDFAMLVPVEGEPNKYTFTFPTTLIDSQGNETVINNILEMVGASSATEIEYNGFLLKNRDGSKQTPGDRATEIKFSPAVFIPTTLRTFPATVTSEDITTFNFDPNAPADDIRLKGVRNSNMIITQLNGTDIPEIVKESVFNDATGTFEVTFIPLDELGEMAGGELQSVTYKYVDLDNPDIETPPATVTFFGFEPPEEPETPEEASSN